MAKEVYSPIKGKQEFCNDYDNVNLNIDPAVSVASQNNSYKLSMQLETTSNTFSSEKIIGTDNAVNSLKASIDSIKNLLKNLSAAALSYNQVERAYISLKQQIKEFDIKYATYIAECNNGPDQNDYNYNKEVYNEKADDFKTKTFTSWSDFNAAKDSWIGNVKSHEHQLYTLGGAICDMVANISKAQTIEPSDIINGSFDFNFEGIEPVHRDAPSDTLSDDEIYDILFGYGYRDIRKLEGEELEEYCEKYAIGPSRYWGYSVGHYEYDENGNGHWIETDRVWGKDIYEKYDIDIDVYVCERTINGVPYNFTFAYDNNQPDTVHREFEEIMESRVAQIYNIPDYCLKQIKENGCTKIILKESEVCDAWAHIKDTDMEIEAGNGGGSLGDSIYANYFPNGYNDKDPGVFLHELGHQFDSSYSTGDDWLKLTETENNSYLDAFADGQYKFDNWDSFSADEKKIKSIEYFAECFRRYCSEPEKLESACGNSYDEMSKIMKQVQEKWQQ